MEYLNELLLIALFLMLSAFFSGSETAFFSLSKLQLKKIEKNNSKHGRRVIRLLNKTRRLLITILLGNTLVNIAASSVAAVLTIRLNENILHIETGVALSIEVIVMTLLLLILGEITPKLLAYARAEKIALASGLVLEILTIILFPIIYLLELLSNIFAHKSETDNSDVITSEDFRNLINSKAADHPLEEDEKKMLRRICRLPSTEAKEIMIPRVDIIGVEVKSSMEDLIQTITNSGHSRIPIYENSIDEITGFVYAKDILLNKEKKIDTLLRLPIFVPENINVHNLLNMFLSRKIHIAVVVDEYGGTSGLVSLEDILEEVFGEIIDEHDDEKLRFKCLDNNEYLINAMLSIPDINHEFDLDIDEEVFDNLASFIYGTLNRVPKRLEQLVYKKRAVFTVINIKGNRINYVKMKLLPVFDSQSDE
ncbi:MAG: hemolysin family protein [Candidatus Cloacimonetes bacterium]|nr:hemolysin family protein [Candidatus Cloacimonadota bacterium]